MSGPGGGPESRLRRRRDFQKTYRSGQKFSGRRLRVFVQSNGLDQARIGVTVTRKSGSAVHRNRLRRQIREVVRKVGPSFSDRGVDIVIHVRPSVREATFRSLEAELVKVLESVFGSGDRGGSRGDRRWKNELSSR